MSRTTPSARVVPRQEPKRRLRTSNSETHPFEQIVIELAGAFVRVTTDEIDGEINRWLERIVLALGLDRGTIAEINPSDGWAVFSHGWARDPGR